MTEPELGWTSSGKVVRLVDGDTIDVEVTRIFRIRLRDCWAPETRTKNPAEKILGIKARNRMGELVLGKEVTIHIPQTAEGEMQDVTTLGRFVGDVWCDGENVAEVLASEGYVGKTKSEQPRG